MASERKRVWGELAAWHMAHIVARLPFTAQVIDFREINPYGKPKPPNPELDRLIAWKNQQKMKALAGVV